MGREQAKQILFYHFNTAKIYKLRNGLSLILNRAGLLRRDFFSHLFYESDMVSIYFFCFHAVYFHQFKPSLLCALTESNARLL